MTRLLWCENEQSSSMKLAEPEGTNKNVREKASGYKVRGVGVDLERKYSCYETKNIHIWQARARLGGTGALGEDMGGMLGGGMRGRDKGGPSLS